MTAQQGDLSLTTDTFIKLPVIRHSSSNPFHSGRAQQGADSIEAELREDVVWFHKNIEVMNGVAAGTVIHKTLQS